LERRLQMPLPVRSDFRGIVMVYVVIPFPQ
jgi:hypothetical protein